MGQREETRATKRQAIIDAGLARMLSDSIDLLRSALNASLLSSEADISKDTTYRLFTDGNGSSSDSIVREVASAAARPHWSGFTESANEVASTFQNGIEQELPFDQALIEAMATNVQAQFRSLGAPVGWLFHAAAMTASPAWEGSAGLSGEDKRLGQELLDVRAKFYQWMTDELMQLMVAAMSMVNRRPRRGMDPRQLLAVLHSMIDGAVLRRFIEPEVFDNRLIGEAVYALAMAFSEDGALSDPRRPGSPEGERVFDDLVNTASVSWTETSDRSVDSSAHEAGVPLDVARLLFPSIADLADSVIWTKVLGGGSLIDNNNLVRTVGAAPATEMAMVFGLLRRLRDVVDLLPGAITIVSTKPPVIGIGIRTQLEREIAEVLRCHCPGVQPQVTAVELVGAGFAGRDGWPAVTSLMHILGIS